MATRTRTRGQSGSSCHLNVSTQVTKRGSCPGLGHAPYYVSADGLPENTFEVGSAPVSTLCTISDVVGCKANFNGCSHTKFTSYPINYDATLNAEGILAGFGSTHPNSFVRLGPSEFHVSVSGKINPQYFMGPYPHVYNGYLPDVDWGTLVADVGERLDGSMASNANVIVTAAELLKTVSMLRNPFGVFKNSTAGRAIKDASELFRKKALRKLTLRDITKSTASAWLEARYGWANVINDTLAIGAVMDECLKHREYILSHLEGGFQCRKRQVDVVPVTPFSATSIWLSSEPGCELRVESAFVKRTCTFGCVNKDLQLKQVFDFPALIRQRLGAEKMAEAVWDLVPFSFCIDWLINVQKVIGMTPFAFTSHRLERLGHSIKYEYGVNLLLNTNFPYYVPDPLKSSVPIGELVGYTTYQRYPGFPSGYQTYGVFGNLRMINLADGAALIAQRIL